MAVMIIPTQKGVVAHEVARLYAYGSFTFDETGRWTVTLLSVDGSSVSATIAVSAGLVIKVF